MLVDNTTKAVAYLDDLTAAGTIIRLSKWWETLCRLGPKFGYFPEGSKSWLIVKKKVVIITKGQQHLGAVIGLETFKQKYVQEK